MSKSLMIRIAVGMLLFLGVSVAYGRLKESMHTPPTVPDNVRIIAGDRLELDGARIHLFGIDAPEPAQTCGPQKEPYACGQRSKAALEKLFLQAANISCSKEADDRDGWTLAVCRVNGLDVNGEMVRTGQALADRYDSFAYIDHEEEAEEAGRGLWASKFQPPWVWRKAQQ